MAAQVAVYARTGDFFLQPPNERHMLVQATGLEVLAIYMVQLAQMSRFYDAFGEPDRRLETVGKAQRNTLTEAA